MNDINKKIKNNDILTEENILRTTNSCSGNCFYKTASLFFNNNEIFNKINEDQKKIHIYIIVIIKFLPKLKIVTN